jgi:hypothetical protein
MRKTADVAFRSEHCTISIGRPVSGVVVVLLVGNDVGQFGDAPFKALAEDLDGPAPIELFIDARAGVAATMDVSSEWALWLAQHRRSFRHVSMLTGSRFIQLSASFVRKFADLGEAMRIYTDPATFEGALTNSIANAALTAKGSP